MGVALSRGETGVAQKFLNRTKIRTSLEQMSGERVSQGMWADAPGQRDLEDPAVEDGSDRSICQSTTAMIEKQGGAGRITAN